MIELENGSQAGLRHFVSVEWACTQEIFPAMTWEVTSIADTGKWRSTVSRMESSTWNGKSTATQKPWFTQPRPDMFSMI